MSRVTDFRIDTVEMTLADYQRLTSWEQVQITTYCTWLHTPRMAALDGGLVRFEIPVHRWKEIMEEDPK